MNKEKFLKSGLLEQYILGLTNEEESLEVERYAESFPEIAKEIEETQAALEQYAMQYISMPPEELKSKVMSDIDTEIAQMNHRNNRNGMASTGTRPTGRRWLTIAFGVLAAVSTIFAFIFYQGKMGAQKNYNQVVSEFATFKSDCEKQQKAKRELDQIYAFFQHPETAPVKLSGSAIAPDAEALAFLNHEQKTAYINLTKLPSPPEGKTYQLWADVEGHMINMGVVDASVQDFQLVKYIEDAESLNLTLEPKGGSEEPTVELLYVNGIVG
jgi:anti-sigma-K factor RskA